jgi:hypothetical protein
MLKKPKMIRQLILILISFMGLAAMSWADVVDPDGELSIRWSAPSLGDPLSHYEWTYTINGVVDSVTGTSAASDTMDESVVLTERDDWAIFTIKAISIHGDKSPPVTSDRVIFVGFCEYLPGDTNESGNVNGIDVLYLVGFFKSANTPSNCLCGHVGQLYVSADANGDCEVNGLDVAYMVNYFKGGPAILHCQNCPPGG